MPEPVLRKSPLASVICELRFQPADAELHVVDLAQRFEAIGLDSYNREQGVQVQMGPGQLHQRDVERHRFETADGAASLTLDQGIFSYEVVSYEGIDDFLIRWQAIATAIAETVSPEARNRIGLRYVNEVPLVGSDREAVKATVNADLMPPWGARAYLEELSASLHELRFKQEEGELAFRHGLQREPGSAPVYLLDFDHYEQRLRDFDGAAEVDRLRTFNARIYEIFRWSITDESYAAFDPEERPDAS